jgi:hypothetical protein
MTQPSRYRARKSNVAELVGGQKRTSESVLETMFSSMGHYDPDHVSATELLSPFEPIDFTETGEVANTTYDFVTRGIPIGLKPGTPEERAHRRNLLLSD